MEEARAAGAMAMFGEKYGDTVRQVYVMDDEASDVTRELCGGCHVRRTGEIGLFRIVAEESVAAGVRRVEAVTGWNALRHVQGEDDLLHRIGETVKAGSLADVETRVRSLADEHDRLKRELTKLQSASLQQAAGELTDRARDVEGVAFLAEEIPADGVDGLREAADKLRDHLKSGAGVLAARTGDKAAFLAFVTDDLVKDRGLRADVLVREVAKVAGGGGGGRPNLATAGAKQPEKIADALAAAEGILRDQLSAKA
jgi:alanyl-tRNA synthetase